METSVEFQCQCEVSVHRQLLPFYNWKASKKCERKAVTVSFFVVVLSLIRYNKRPLISFSYFSLY